ncbi:potassium voltage-gated channel subfamily B member 2-like [Mya arenaria]|nr:potassium voltage-gated channel subfamily B member 2-like [Mya arenaria]
MIGNSPSDSKSAEEGENNDAFDEIYNDAINKNTKNRTENNNTAHDFVTINISGHTYEIEIDDIRRAPSSRLHRYAFSGKQAAMDFKRPISSFEAVLAYYQTGELHMPLSVCPSAFKSELDFWELDPQIMMKCCYYRYLSHEDDMETIDHFHRHLFPDDVVRKRKRTLLPNLRQKLWNIIDFNDKNIITTIYFWLCTLMVILSVMTLALSSLPQFKRNLTKCELEDYLGKEMQMVSRATANADDSCEEPLADDVYSGVITDFEEIEVKDKSELTEDDVIVKEFERKVNVTDSGLKPTETTNDFAKNDFQRKGNVSENDNSENSTFVPALVRSAFDFRFNLADTVEDSEFIEHVFQALRPNVGIEKKTVRIKTLVYLDTIALGFFTLDLLLRIFSCPNIKKYFLSTINVIDALAVLSSYAHLTVNILRKNEQYEFSNFDILEIFQVLRVVRLLRIVRDVIGFKVLSFSLRHSSKDLFVLFLYMILGMTIFANFIFFVESEQAIDSIPTGWWWAISTLTTVGYGDVTPTTLYGRLIGGICAVSGVVVMAISIPVFVKTFMLLYAYAVLYKKSLHKPEDTHRYIHRIGRQNAAALQKQLNNSNI